MSRKVSQRVLHVGVGVGRPGASVPGQGVVVLAAAAGGGQVVVVRRRVLLGVVAAQRVDRDPGPERAAGLVLVVLLEAEPPSQCQVFRLKSLNLFVIWKKTYRPTLVKIRLRV